jgi:hypothetical protein
MEKVRALLASWKAERPNSIMVFEYACGALERAVEEDERESEPESPVVAEKPLSMSYEDFYATRESTPKFEVYDGVMPSDRNAEPNGNLLACAVLGKDWNETLYNRATVTRAGTARYMRLIDDCGVCRLQATVGDDRRPGQFKFNNCDFIGGESMVFYFRFTDNRADGSEAAT